MAMRRFVEAAGKETGTEYRGADRIPGTNKVRTYVTGAWLYSKESDLKKIIRKRMETLGISEIQDESIKKYLGS